MCFSLILVLIANVLCGTSPCESVERLKPVYADTITDCLKSIPMNSATMNPALLNSYIDILIEYVGSSSYFYLFMDGQDKYPSYNTLQDLKDLKASISSSTNYFQFCEKIHIILSRLKDCRVGAGYPYLGNFVYFLPFAFTTANVYNSDNITHLELVPNTYTLNVSLLENEDGSNDGLKWLLTDLLDTDRKGDPPNFIIKEIDFTSGDGTAYLPASHALSYYALKENDYTSDPHGAYNYVIKGYMMGFNAAYMMHPTEPGKYNQIIKLKGQNISSSSSADVVIDVPFWGLYRGPENATWDTLSPLISSSSSFAKKNSGKKPLRRLHPSEDEKIPKKARNTNKPYTSSLVQSAYEKMMSKRHTSSPLLSATAPVKFNELYEYVEYGYVICRVLSDPVNKIGYLLFLEGYDFEDVTKPDQFYTGLGKAYRTMVDQGVESVIVDMRGHEGGYVSVFEAIFDFLFHNALYPRSTESDVIKSTANAEVIRFFQQYPDKMGLDFSEWQPFIVHYDDETVTKIHVDRSRYPPKSYGADHTTRLFCEECIPSTLSQAYGGYSPFDAQHIYLVTDGDCFGGCAIMTLQAVELNVARVLGYGWNPAFEDKLHTYAPGVCTGTYWGSDVIEYLVYYLDEDGFMNTSNLPPYWKWDDPRLHFTFTHFEEFSRNPDKLGESLWYSNATVHEVLPFKVNADPPTVENAQDIAQKIVDLYITPQYCFASEVLVDAACQTPERTALHQLYGRPCETVNGKSTFSKTKCLYAACERGYYFNGTFADFGGDCVPIPGEAPSSQGGGGQETKSTKDKFPGWGVALIVIIVVLAIVIVVLVVVLLVGGSNKGKGVLLPDQGSSISRSSFSEEPDQKSRNVPHTSFREEAEPRKDAPAPFREEPEEEEVEEEIE